MATTSATVTAKRVKGGSFLTEERQPQDIFTPEDFSEEQRQIAKTTIEFTTNEVVPAAALWWMLIGGLCYTCGTLLLVHDNRHPLLHAVWHVFVIAGSTCHFMTILFFVGDLPKGT